MFRIIVFCTIFLSSTLSSFCQTSIDKLVNQMVQDHRANKVISSATGSLFETKNIPLSISAFSKYVKDSVPSVRFLAIGYLSNLGNKSIELLLRQSTLILLIQSTKDTDPTVSKLAWESILTFNRSDFEGKPIDAMKKYTFNETNQLGLYAKTNGFLNLVDKTEALKNLLATTISQSQKWQVHLALAALGDKTSTDYVIEKAKKTPIDDNWILSLAPDLAFTRSKPIYDLLFNIVLSNEKNCTSPNPDDNSKIPCAFSVLGNIASFIKSFPVQIDETGDILGDYQKALKTSREWITKNRNTYTFNY